MDSSDFASVAAGDENFDSFAGSSRTEVTAHFD